MLCTRHVVKTLEQPLERGMHVERLRPPANSWHQLASHRSEPLWNGGHQPPLTS